MSSIFKTIARVAPIATAFIPGVGPLLGAAIGAAGGALSGGGLKGALLGGATGALGAGGAGNLVGKAGLSGVAGKAASGALTGASAGLYSGGGLKSALTGAAVGGAGNALAGGLKIPGVSGTERSLLGTSAGTPLANGAQGATQGSGLLGSITRGLSGSGGSFSSYAKPASLIYSGIQASAAQDDMQDQLLAQQRRSEQLFSPYTASGESAVDRLNNFDSEALENDPGYQFQLEQGQKALDRSSASRGNLYSGAALKEALEYGQGLADQTYNDAFSRNYQLANQGLSAAGAQSGVYDNMGNIQANSTANKSNILNQSLSGLLEGDTNLQIVGYNPDGSPIYV